MKNISSIFITGVLAASLIGCASMPNTESMTQLDSQQVNQLLVGNTWTNLASWGRWSEYYGENNSGVGRASGSFGEHVVNSKYSVSEDGETCSVYEGEYDWADSETQYCSLIFIDENSRYYSKTTQSNKQEKIGRINKFEIHQGNHYDLSM